MHRDFAQAPSDARLLVAFGVGNFHGGVQGRDRAAAKDGQQRGSGGQSAQRAHQLGAAIDFGELEAGQAKTVKVTARADDGSSVEFEATVRLDTPNEVTYFVNGGILQTVLRNLRG